MSAENQTLILCMSGCSQTPEPSPHPVSQLDSDLARYTGVQRRLPKGSRAARLIDTPGVWRENLQEVEPGGGKLVQMCNSMATEGVKSTLVRVSIVLKR